MDKPKEPLLISECLCGVCCRYDGNHNKIDGLDELEKIYRLIPVCPEVLGGLDTPRDPAERCGERILTCMGTDVTEAFTEGAERVLRRALKEGCTLALLKANSPSCGCGHIYDGTFTKTLTEGNGITAEILMKHSIRVYTEQDISDLIETHKIKTKPKNK